MKSRLTPSNHKLLVSKLVSSDLLERGCVGGCLISSPVFGSETSYLGMNRTFRPSHIRFNRLHGLAFIEEGIGGDRQKEKKNEG